MSETTAADDADHNALELAIKVTLAETDESRVEQVRSMLESRDRLRVGQFCAYHRQMDALGLKPWQSPPCWIVTEEEADAILARGPVRAADGSGVDISNCKPARLLKRMLRFGVSPHHPDPVAAIAEAQRKRKARST
jgi:hypothetical protein